MSRRNHASLLSTVAYHGAPGRLYPYPGTVQAVGNHPLSAYLRAYVDGPSGTVYASFPGGDRPPFDPSTFPARYQPNVADLPIPRDVTLPPPEPAPRHEPSPNARVLAALAARPDGPGSKVVRLPRKTTNPSHYARRYPQFRIRSHQGYVYVLNAPDSYAGATHEPPPPARPLPLPPPPGRIHLYTRTRVPVRQLPGSYTYAPDPQAPSRFYLDLPDDEATRGALCTGEDPLHLFAMFHGAFYTLHPDAPDLPPFPPRYVPLTRKETLQ